MSRHGVKSDIHKQQWEESDFPHLCETCLGPNPHVRMLKKPYGKACKICDRPFTEFRWKPGKGARFKTTQICQVCAKLKNVCQTCILDLQYGLPVQVRDSLLGEDEKIDMPQSSAGMEYFSQRASERMAKEGAQGGRAPNQMLKRMARRKPFYERNEAHICSFFVRGECTRGSECPFRHVMPKAKSDPLANQNIKDRFYGKDDPVAEKILRRQQEIEEERKEKNASKAENVEPKQHPQHTGYNNPAHQNASSSHNNTQVSAVDWSKAKPVAATSVPNAPAPVVRPPSVPPPNRQHPRPRGPPRGHQPQAPPMIMMGPGGPRPVMMGNPPPMMMMGPGGPRPVMMGNPQMMGPPRMAPPRMAPPRMMGPPMQGARPSMMGRGPPQQMFPRAQPQNKQQQPRPQQNKAPVKNS
eukprot:TRINITY_DN9144_c0_g1_i1.p1 TRINITY_DN9144_c0_g1~~TRINITY_DN9144_c0_g1_i1.p1  ORF type:complete len:411 (+),score=133.86 TRINITY_DN9144_c0_g1_i1:46-1278(+)